jgi:iron complex outermembrane receptor protein
MNNHRFQLTILSLSLALGTLRNAGADEVPAQATPTAEYKLEELVIESSPLQQTLEESAQPVSVLTGSDLDAKAQTSLGDTLASEPGVSSSSFGPAAGRPVIRGLGGDRIRILENGVGTQDISSSSPDHAVTIESSLVEKIEVIRGPASLLYGTSAVGGIVNVFDNRIPERLPDSPLTGSLELRGESVNSGRSALMNVTAPVGPFALHVDGFKRRTDDVRIPGFARTESIQESVEIDYPEPRGKIPFSDSEADNLTLGSSYIFDKGFIGAAVSEFNTNYGVPNGENDISIDAKRRRVDVRGELRQAGTFVDSITTRMGITDYNHTEYEGAEAGTYFSQNAFEGRLDMKHSAVASITGTWGLQLQANDFEAEGEEAYQPPTKARTYSLFVLEEAPVSESVTFQLGGRFDWSDLDTTGFDAIQDDDQSRFFTTFSQSAGAVWDVTDQYSLALSVAHSERAPNGQELFTNGPHVATGSFEVGDQNLETERSLGTDLTLRKTSGTVRGSIGGFYNHFWDYIALNPTGATEDSLPVYAYEALDADFMGFESQVSFHAIDKTNEELFFDIQPDYVRAKDRDNDTNLPRIPPFRLKTGVTYFHEDLFRARFEVQQVFAQRETASFETSADGYTMMNAYLSKDIAVGDQVFEVFLRGSNLLNEKARNHVSFIKDVAPLPGASALLGIRVRF